MLLFFCPFWLSILSRFHSIEFVRVCPSNFIHYFGVRGNVFFFFWFQILFFALFFFFRFTFKRSFKNIHSSNGAWTTQIICVGYMGDMRLRHQCLHFRRTQTHAQEHKEMETIGKPNQKSTHQNKKKNNSQFEIRLGVALNKCRMQDKMSDKMKERKIAEWRKRNEMKWKKKTHRHTNVSFLSLFFFVLPS